MIVLSSLSEERDLLTIDENPYWPTNIFVVGILTNYYPTDIGRLTLDLSHTTEHDCQRPS